MTTNTTKELPKSYDPAAVEAEANRVWFEEKCFAADPARPGPPYTIVIPPPNVTGALHLGHAINNTLQDILTRVHRMRGFNTLWVPGIDHAGIATQAVVEKQLKEKENKTRHDVGREELVRRIWAWKEQYGNRIIEQLRRLGCSCDWDRTRFTLDDMCAKAVRQTFFKLFKDGLIYRGKRLVNWDIQLQTSISDDEIYHETVKTSMWHIRYPIVDEENLTTEDTEDTEKKEELNSGLTSASSVSSVVSSSSPRPTYMTVATTRPETMLGDTAVAVHSQDPRWNWAIGKKVRLPLTDRLIPIIADDILVDMEFGSGVVKVTPAHDPNDYAVWQRHQGKPDEIGIINILNPQGTINANGGKYADMKRDAARKKVVEDLTALGLLEKEEPYETQVGHSDRSKTPIEPYLSDQWFVKMAPLAEPALEVVRNGTIKFFPERHAQQYLAWLGEKRDWPISRQLWWGHRIPVWSRVISVEADPNAGSMAESVRGLTARESNGDTAILSNFQNEFSAAQTNSVVLADGRRATEIRICIAEGHPELEQLAESEGCRRDEDVLDTWFSSALWPHSTLGWPEETPELKKYYPTSVLLTGRDIITLWVARMVMTGMYNMGEGAPNSVGWASPTTSAEEGGHCPPYKSAKPSPSPSTQREGRGEGSSAQSSVLGSTALAAGSPQSSPDDARRDLGKRLGIPFLDVAINPTILDGKGERMSKSKGNGVDPVEIIDTHGADALRFTLTLMATETQDARLPVKKDAQGRNTSEKFDIGRRFAIKIWNAARLTLDSIQSMPIGPAKTEAAPFDPANLTLIERWIIGRFNSAVADANAALESYRFDQYAKTCYDFFWRDFCDWYLEAIKPSLKDPARAALSAEVLVAVLDGALRLLHPMIPFITEVLWWHLNDARPERGIPNVLECPASLRLILANWPKGGALFPGTDVVDRVQEIVTAIRNLRNEHNVDPKRIIDVVIIPPDAQVAELCGNKQLIEQFAH
ncbi:MAG: valine--tRNA ligase, partial [Tepidisphaeraceae bacterium]